LAARWSAIGGHPVVDLLNTVDWRLDPGQRRELIDDYNDALEWSREKGVLSAAEEVALAAMATARPRLQAREAVAFRAFRETLYGALVERDGAAARQVVETYSAWLANAELEPADGGWIWRDRRLRLEAPRLRLARDGVALITDPSVTRLRQCQDAACGWVYLDLSPRGNRRWCVAADCGNRNRVRAFYARRRETRTQA
jgi:predicted RNA-binding Zn ribbon-like protein